MKRINKLVLGFLIIAFSVLSCKKDFQEVNTNPAQLNDTKPEFLFTNASLNYNESRQMYLDKYSTVMRYMQYIVGDDINTDAMESPYYNPAKQPFPDPGGNYANYYTSIGRDMHRVADKINSITDETLKAAYQNLLAASQIIDTYEAWKITDRYGAMPYTQAFKVEEFPLPSFDYNWDLYLTYDKQLKASVDILTANTTGQIDFSKQDLFYAGDREKWIRVANTLRIKIAQRYEKRDGANLAAVINDISTNYGGQIISSNDESFGVDFLRDWGNNTNDIDAILLNYDAAYPFVEFLKSTKDPRLALMVRQNDWGDNYAPYTAVKTYGTAASKATLDSLPLNTSRYWGKHVFSASTGGAYGWLGQPKTHQFSIVNAGATDTKSLNFISVVQTRLFVKNGGFGNSISGLGGLHTDETVVDGTSIKMRRPLLGYAETCFMMAEIAAKGGNGLGKSAAQWYNDGITASFNDYKEKGIAQNTPNAAAAVLGDFLTRYPYKDLKSIYSQAWVNFLTVPEEAWAMWKRTGYPEFDDFRADKVNKIGDGSGIAYLENLFTGSQNLLLPRRSVLPVTSTEMNVNIDNAVSDMKTKDASFGADRLDTKGRIWWDKE